MITAKQCEQYINLKVNELTQIGPRFPFGLGADWLDLFDNGGGVYCLFDSDHLVYVGETGDLVGRMDDLRKTLNHSCRRNLGKFHFSDKDGFQAASRNRKFPPHIEQMVDEYCLANITVCAVNVLIGRKEIEERIQPIIGKSISLNKRGIRKPKIKKLRKVEQSI